MPEALSVEAFLIFVSMSWTLVLMFVLRVLLASFTLRVRVLRGGIWGVVV